MKIQPEKIILIGSFTDGRNIVHQEVEIGYLLKGKDCFAVHSAWDGKSRTVFQSLMLAPAITKFSDLDMPVANDFLLSLYIEDFESLIRAYDGFIEKHRCCEMIGENELKLTFGIKKNDLIFDIIEFTDSIDVKDLFEAETKFHVEYCKIAYLAGKEIIRLKQSSGNAILECDLNLNDIADMYFTDISALIHKSKSFNFLYKESTVCSAIKKQAFQAIKN